MNLNMSKTLMAVALFVTIMVLFTAYHQVQTRSLLLPAICNSSGGYAECSLALARGKSVQSLDVTRSLANPASNEVGEQEVEVAKMCQFPDLRDNKSSDFYAVLAAMRVLIPKTFHPKFKNPCWYADFRMPLLKGRVERFYNRSIPFYDLVKFKTANDSKTLHCLPYFFIAGFPRSGTTTLYSLIGHHRQFTAPVYKEVHWLTHSKFDQTFPNNLRSVLRYIYHFDRTAEKIEQDANLVTCDASASTLWDVGVHSNDGTFECQTPLLLSYILPGAKYIVLLRDPLKRLYSEFWYYCRSDHMIKLLTRNGPRLFHQLVEKSLDLFIICKSRYSLLWCLHTWQDGVEKGRCNSVRLHASLYYLHIIKWFSVIPRKQFLFIKSEDLFDDPEKTLKEVFEFLKLSPVSDKTTLVNLLKFADNSNENVHKEYYNHSMAVLDETKLLLGNFFKPFNRKLANLLQDDRFLWDDV